MKSDLFHRSSEWLARCDTLYLALSFVCYSTAEVKILKVISRVSYYCSMGPGRSSEPKQQCWPERPLKTNLNSLWHRTFIYPIDTGCIAPGCLVQPRSIFHIFTVDKQRWLWQSYSCWSMSRCVCLRVRECACTVLCVINVKSVTEQLCLEQSLRSCFVQWLNCLFFFPYLPSSLFLTQCVSIRLFPVHPPLLCLRPGEMLRL